MESIWNGNPSSENLTQNVACYISYDGKNRESIPAFRLPQKDYGQILAAKHQISNN